MTRIRTTLLRARAEGRKAMGLFITNGFPAPAHTLPLLQALDAGGADFIELGMPFSDPLAEGLPIQRSSACALRHGVTLDDALRTAEQFRAGSETPLLLMGYINPIFRYGVSNFCRAAGSSGVDGLILPDLPPEESSLVAGAAQDAGLGLVHLIAPNTGDDRIRQIDGLATGFVYAVTITGLTGSRIGAVDAVDAYLARARRLVRHNPLLAGFGIKTHGDAERLSRHTDGFIVGSALIEAVEALWADPQQTPAGRLEAVRRFAHALKHGAPASHR